MWGKVGVLRGSQKGEEVSAKSSYLALGEKRKFGRSRQPRKEISCKEGQGKPGVLGRSTLRKGDQDKS